MIFLTALGPIGAQGQTTCEIVTANSEVTYSKDPKIIDQIVRPQWPKQLTDPRHHDPNNFMYVIRVQAPGADAEYINGIPRDPKKGMLNDVQRANYISASLIGRRPDGREALANVMSPRTGSVVILKVPASAIHVAVGHDTGRVANSDGDLPGRASLINDEMHYGVHTPEALIDATIEIALIRFKNDRDRRPENHYNEIIFVGSKEVEIIGVAQFGTGDEAAKKKAAILGVPAIRIR